MHCPFCHSPIHRNTPECGACRLSYPRANVLLGAVPKMSLGVSDKTNSLRQPELGKIRKRLSLLQNRFPGVTLQIVVHSFVPQHPFSLHAFWLFNAGNFSGDSKRGKDNRVLMLVLDPVRNESAFVTGYALEPFLQDGALGHLLELAGPSWESGNWADGIQLVIEGLGKLLASVAIPIDPKAEKIGEF